MTVALHHDDAEMLIRSGLARYSVMTGWQIGEIVRGTIEWRVVTDEIDAATLSRVNRRIARV